MASVSLTNDGLRAVKRALVSRFPHDKSAHLTEALAAACGFRTHASLLGAVNATDPGDPDFILLDETAFLTRREELTGKPCAPQDQYMLFDGLSLEHGTHVLNTISSKFHLVDYSKSSRRRAWRNAMVAGINEGLARRFFSLRPGDNRWPGTERERHERQQAHVFRFAIGDIPAIASLWDAGWDELSIHVALWPTADAERWVPAANAGFHAGDLFASGWLERRNGAWLQVSSDSRQNWSFRCRKQRLAEAAALELRPAGYADRGNFAL
ncbi:hypothetical protein [Sphingomonas sp. KC8]|uniref:hypothetical protein n=1 Tax=Sphingomonas sp. KC8 TaxID=1030157 RepID=UPI000248B24C|nr:hypothetical protein [Sphingomonas sp. KC8]ARS26970.1 hypothetical protein KC8_06660 [Sphingomonas sp. KC8]